MSEHTEKVEAPDPAPTAVTHAPATRLDSGEILSSPEDHERHAARAAEAPAETPSATEEVTDG